MSTITFDDVDADYKAVKLQRELDLLVSLCDIWGQGYERRGKSIKVNGRKIKPEPLTSFCINWNFVVSFKGKILGIYTLSTLPTMPCVAELQPV